MQHYLLEHLLDPAIRVESGLDDLGYLDQMGHFLVCQAGLIHKLDYLDVTQIFNRSYILYKKTMVSDKQVNLGSGKCTESSQV